MRWLTIAMGLFSLGGDAPDDLKLVVLTEIREALTEAGQQFVETEAPIDHTIVVLACSVEEESCRRSVAETLEFDELLYGSLVRRGKAFELTLVRSKSDGTIRATSNVSVPSKDVLAAAARGAVSSLFPQPAASPPPLAEEPTPPIPEEPPPPVLVQETEVPPAGNGSIFGISSLVVGGVGVALVIAGIVTGAMASSAQGDFDTGIAALPTPVTMMDVAALAELRSLRERGERDATISRATTGSGAALLGIAAVLAYFYFDYDRIF